MKGLGLIARADNRGIHLQSHAVARNLPPERVLVVDLSENSPYPLDVEAFPDAWAIVTPADMDEPLLRAFLDGLTCVYMAETPYRFELFDIARSMGVRTVVHVNPEFFTWWEPVEPEGLPAPDVFALPSTWRQAEIRDRFPNTALLPMPCDLDHYPTRIVEKVETFVHVAGHRAVHDRNGTHVLAAALKHVTQPMRVIVRAQQPVGSSFRTRVPKHVDLDIRVGNVADNRDLYEDADALVLPRRYGGNCQPVMEALALGLPVVGSDRNPESGWLPDETRATTRDGHGWKTQGGVITIGSPQPQAVAAIMDRLVADPEFAREMAARSRAKAQELSWGALRPLWEQVLSGDDR